MKTTEIIAKALTLLDAARPWSDAVFDVHAFLDDQLYWAAVEEEKAEADFADYQEWANRRPRYRPLVPFRGR